MTLDRHLLGDVALAMLLVLPTAAIAGASGLPTHHQPAPTAHSSAAAKAAPAERTMAERGVHLLG